MDKEPLRQAILAQLAADFALQARAAQMAREEATSEESKAESKYDTRGQEAAYLAESQAKLAAEAQQAHDLYASLPLPSFQPDDAIALGAVVRLRSQGRTATYFLGPRHGGLELEVGGESLTLITPQSPLGRQLLGQHVGSVVQLPGRGGKPVPHEIVALA